MDPQSKLLERDETIAVTFSEKARPSVRTWETWRKRRVIPYVMVGRKIFYDAAEVRLALAKKFTVRARQDGDT